MDPQSVAFVPHNESWRVHNELLRLQQVQADHTDRLNRLERRQDDDARMKSVWGGASPFPSVLSGTPQQAPLHRPPSEQFKDFDDESANLIGSLHLDADDEPRRMGATSRANSVRFDESANQGHWSHASRSSLDFMPRSTSSLGGIPMNERTSSHKSEGRASSVHSVRSAASGRASSLNMDTAYSLGDPNRSPLDTPVVAPGLLILGPVPSIIRCWMNTDFKHDALLYAAIASASHKSHIDFRLVRKLGFEDRVVQGVAHDKVVELSVYFPEAVPHPASSRSSSPAPQVPSLSVEFIVDNYSLDIGEPESKSVQIFIGSNTLRTHNADIMFSTNSMTLYDDEQCKLSIPLVRPENEAVFNSLFTTGEAIPSTSGAEKQDDATVQHHTSLNGLGQTLEEVSESTKDASTASSTSGKYRAPGVIAAESGASSPRRSMEEATVDEAIPSRETTANKRPSLSVSSGRVEAKEAAAEGGSSQPTSAQPSPAIWSNWRRDTPSQNSQFDWTGSGKKQEGSYQRRDTGIKVLKPMRVASRTVSLSAGSPSPADGKSRFFDEGKRRSVADPAAVDEKRATAPSLSRKASTTKENQPPAGAGAETAPKTRTNPIGGASAFSWLNSNKS